MVMRVHQPGQDQVAAQIKEFVSRRGERTTPPDVRNEAIPHKQAPIGDLAPFGVLGDYNRGVADQESAHSSAF
jgi:hypothetical protein